MGFWVEHWRYLSHFEDSWAYFGTSRVSFISIWLSIRVSWYETCLWYYSASWCTWHCLSNAMYYVSIISLNCIYILELWHWHEFISYCIYTTWDIVIHEKLQYKVCDTLIDFSIWTVTPWVILIYGLWCPWVLFSRFDSIDVYIGPAMVMIPPHIWPVML